ncbi:MAG TPA: hypothetical protein VL295_01845 [Gemmatimonadales bacterium]|jgi:hypothetical protein|nr:hypothetical protein [Gemmatimonadales bacterium]
MGSRLPVERKWIAILLIALTACLTGESDDALGDARYEIDVNCETAVCVPPGPLTRGDTAWVMIIYQDPTPDSTALPMIRPICATNVEVRRADLPLALIQTFPAEPWCPDSLIPGGENWPGSSTVGRLFQWGIPTDLNPGHYILTAKILAEPHVDRSITVEIR